MNIDSKLPLVSVVIPTLASTSRTELLKRAVASVRSSSKYPIQIIAVVNGNRFDPDLCEWLKIQPDVEFEYLSQPSLPGALMRGRELVKTKFFSTLDDDDEYLPFSTDIKLDVLAKDRDADLVVGNYFQYCAGRESLRYSDLSKVRESPMEILMSMNWLHNCNALFRSDSIPINYFNEMHAYAEWTFIAFRLALDRKVIATIDQPVARCYGDTQESLSKSANYIKAYLPLFERMLSYPLSDHIVRMIKRKISAAHHDASVLAMEKGEWKLALHHHWNSLRLHGGYRYISYSRHFLKKF